MVEFIPAFAAAAFLLAIPLITLGGTYLEGLDVWLSSTFGSPKGEVLAFLLSASPCSTSDGSIVEAYSELLSVRLPDFFSFFFCFFWAFLSFFSLALSASES